MVHISLRVVLGAVGTAAALALGGASAGHGPVVYHVPLRGTLTQRDVRVVERAVTSAAAGGATAVVISAALAGGGTMALDLATVVRQAAVPVYVIGDSPPSGATLMLLAAAQRAYLTPRFPPSATEAIWSTATLRREALTRMVADGNRPGDVEAALGSRRPTPGEDPAGPLPIVDGVAGLLVAAGLEDASLEVVDQRWLGTTLEITNDNWQDVRIYVVRGGQRSRLGTVTSLRRVTFRITETDVSPGSRVHLVAEVIGAPDRLATEPFMIEPGLVVEWSIANVLAQSRFSRWVR